MSRGRSSSTSNGIAASIFLLTREREFRSRREDRRMPGRAQTTWSVLRWFSSRKRPIRLGQRCLVVSVAAASAPRRPRMSAGSGVSPPPSGCGSRYRVRGRSSAAPSSGIPHRTFQDSNTGCRRRRAVDHGFDGSLYVREARFGSHAERVGKETERRVDRRRVRQDIRRARRIPRAARLRRRSGHPGGSRRSGERRPL